MVGSLEPEAPLYTELVAKVDIYWRRRLGYIFLERMFSLDHGEARDYQRGDAFRGKVGSVDSLVGKFGPTLEDGAAEVTQVGLWFSQVMGESLTNQPRGGCPLGRGDHAEFGV